MATAAAVALIQPVLLPCLLLAAMPAAVTAVRMARRRVPAMLAHITRHRRMWMLGELMANRHTASEIRAYQMRGFLLGEYRCGHAGRDDGRPLRWSAPDHDPVAGAAFAGRRHLGVYVVLVVPAATARCRWPPRPPR